jgi:Uma2 family endonuclease
MSNQRAVGAGYTVDAYFTLVQDGLLSEDDRVELLDGVIVAEPPMDPPHASGITYVTQALMRAIGDRGVVRVQAPLIADLFSVPEPDVAVVPGEARDYLDRHPCEALLVVEVADSSLPQDRLSKSRIYAGAGVPDYWILNLRNGCVEVFRAPDVEQRVYGARVIARPGDRLELLALPGASVAVDDLVPPRRG